MENSGGWDAERANLAVGLRWREREREKESSLSPFSENNLPRTNKTEFQLALPVKYTVYMVVARCCAQSSPPPARGPDGPLRTYVCQSAHV